MGSGDTFPPGNHWVTIDRAASYFDTDQAGVVERIERGELKSSMVSGQRQVLLEVSVVTADESDDSGMWWKEGNDVCDITALGRDISVRFLTDQLDDQNPLHDSFVEIERKIKLTAPHSVTFDLETVWTLSSSAMGLFFTIAKLTRSTQCAMRIINCSPNIANAFRIVQLHKLCDIDSAEPDIDRRS